ncbi:WD40-repeat-containing domain protein [Vararia minispora EC-137]|uniref:WD40-repeat-containing domain protein n=1 Tax=Vararia minispora EC-137 TaxID=1314806 RepID=A0ACB8QN27_9AGAM|nr:WD40-repeat-containing domain protein [Vararia minispora EC-137]
MLSVATSRKLSFAEAANLKRSSIALFPVCELPDPTQRPTASAWSPDSVSLYLASAHSISRYGASGSLIKTVYNDVECEPIHALIVKDKGTLVFATGSNVHSLEHSASASSSSKIVHSLPPHPDPSAPVISLSLSNDNTLLAVASAHAVLIHNLSLGVHTILRGLPSDAAVTSCVFHPHSRVRLFLGIARELVVYDITRPSGASRVIPMGDNAEGDIVAVACSPYSKTLLAVACSGGYVAMVDLDKEKGRIRSFNYSTRLTSLAFAPDGATLFVGTESGQLLVQTLRAVESPKIVEVGERVESLAITRKAKSSSMDSPTFKLALGNPTIMKPLSPQDINSSRKLFGRDNDKLGAGVSIKRMDSPEPVTDGKPSVTNKSSPIRKRVSSTTVLGSKKAFDAARSLFASVAGEARSDGPQDAATPIVGRSRPTSLAKKENPGGSASRSPTSPAPSKPPSRTSSSRPKAVISPIAGSKTTVARARTVSTTAPGIAATQAALLKTSPPAQYSAPRTRKASNPLSPSSIAGSKSPPPPRVAAAAQKTPSKAPVRVRTVSTTSHEPTVVSTSRPTSSGSSLGARTSSTRPTSVASTARERSPIPPVPRIPKGATRKSSERARTPSPELLDEPPPFPIDSIPARKGLSMLGLATPEIARWIDGDKQKGKERAEQAAEVDVDAEATEDGDAADALAPAHGSKERPLSMQLTPRRSLGGGWAPSPLRNSIAGGSPGTHNVQTMLHALIKDAMLDVRQDIKGEMVGLHLDLVKMGRAWRQEMRGAMEEYVGDLRELREENKRLRDENERLRRGY